MNLGSVIEGADYIISLADHQVRTQQDDRRFVPVVTVKLSENITVIILLFYVKFNVQRYCKCCYIYSHCE